MQSTLNQVRQFHDAFNVATATSPYINNEPLNRLRIKLLQEELNELQAALNDRNEVEVLDALCDLQYVLDGAFLALGFAHLKDEAFAAVHASNMSKLDTDGKPLLRSDCKILKGPNFKPVNLHEIIRGKSNVELFAKQEVDNTSTPATT